MVHHLTCLTVCVVVAVALEVEVTVVVDGEIMQEHAALITAGANGTSKGSL